MPIHRNSWLLRIAGLAVATLMTVLTGCQKPAAPPPPPATPEVYYTKPIVDTITDYEEFPGRTEAYRSVEVRARVTGYLDKVMFNDGHEVEKDAVLFQIDPRPYQAEVDRANATLDQAIARETRLEADYRRSRMSLNSGTVTREEYDRAAGDLAEAKAAVGITKAQLERAKLDLEFTKVTAPIAGRISRRMVDPGNLVKSDETMLTTIVALDPIYAYFDVDERTLLRIRRLVNEGKIKSRSESDVPVAAGLSDETDFPHAGTVDFSENRVDPSTGTLRMRGVIANPITRTGLSTRVLSPGMFLRLRLPIGEPHESILVPEQAVGTDQGKKFVYVINSHDEILYQPVEVGTLNSGLRVILSGLKKDDQVVTRGLQRVKVGMKVKKTLETATTKGMPSTPPAKAATIKTAG